MTKVYTDDNFMYHNCPDAEIASWQNQLIDDYDLDYAPGDRPYIGATDKQISAAYRIADKKRREAVLDNLSSRKEKPQERICIDDATPEQWDAIDRATENIRKQYQEIDWSEAPYWADYWAMDSDGDAYWYSFKPYIDWMDSVWTTCDCVDAAQSFGFPADLWKDSLAERPLEQTDKKEKALDEMTRDAEELDLYDDEIVHDLNKPLSQQVGGDHYSRQKIQPVEFIHANDLGFCEGNCIKYLCRWQDKGGIQDLEKAKHYIELLMELEDDY